MVSILVEVLNRRGRSLNGSPIFLLGVSYKRDVNDARESPAIEIVRELWKRGAAVQYHDPYVPSLAVDGRVMHSMALDEQALRAADCALIVTDHRCIDYNWVVERACSVIDTRNATSGISRNQEKVVKLQ